MWGVEHKDLKISCRDIGVAMWSKSARAELTVATERCRARAGARRV
eukprot:SAG31_NODE_350_length_17241_cov_156.139715_5_plen_46_part_00